MGRPSDTDPRVIDVDGRRVRVFDSLGDFLLIRDALQDELLDDEERFQVLLAMLYADPQGVCDALGGEVAHFVSETLWEAFGIDLEGVHESDDVRVVDWDEDRDYITATTRSAYGMGFEDFAQLPYRECCALVGLAPHETPMGQAVYYRTAKPPKPTKYNAEERKHFREARKFWALGRRRTRARGEDMEAKQSAADASFAALAARVREAADG